MNKRLEAIKKRAKNATAGTWRVEKYYHEPPYEKYIKSAAIVSNGYTITRNNWSNPLEDDLEFIAHARKDIPYLIAEIEKLQALLDKKE